MTAPVLTSAAPHARPAPQATSGPRFAPRGKPAAPPLGRLAIESIVLLAASLVALTPLVSAVHIGPWFVAAGGAVLAVQAVGAAGRAMRASIGRIAIALLLTTLLVAGIAAWWRLGPTLSATVPLDALQTALFDASDAIAYGRMPIESTACLDVALTLGAGLLATAIALACLTGAPAWSGLAMALPWLPLLPSDTRVPVAAFVLEAAGFFALLVTFTRPRAFPRHMHALTASRRGRSTRQPIAWQRAVAAATCAAVAIGGAIALSDRAPTWGAWGSAGSLGSLMRGWFGPHISPKMNVAGARAKQDSDLIGTVRLTSQNANYRPDVLRAYTTTRFDGRQWLSSERSDATFESTSGRLKLSRPDGEVDSAGTLAIDLPHGAPDYLLLPVNPEAVRDLSDPWRYDPASDTATAVNPRPGNLAYAARGWTPELQTLRYANARVTRAQGTLQSAAMLEFAEQVSKLTPGDQPTSHAMDRLAKIAGTTYAWAAMYGEMSNPAAMLDTIAITSDKGLYLEIDSKGYFTVSGLADGPTMMTDDFGQAGLNLDDSREVRALLSDGATRRQLYTEARWLTAQDLIAAARERGALDFDATKAIDSASLEVPPSVDPRAAELAKSLTKDAGSDYDKVLAIQDWLRGPDFTYDDQIAAVPRGVDPVGQFLDTKRGYCLQFATLMAMMTRSLGMPTRVATGYLLSPDGPDNWRITADKLHAWPEIYFATLGWIRFEPTPAGQTGAPPAWARSEPTPVKTTAKPSPSATSTGTAQALPERGPRLEPSQQPDTGRARATEAAAVPSWLIALLAAALVAALAAGLWVAWRRGLFATPGSIRRRDSRLEAAWRRVEAAAASRGLTWRASATLATRAHDLAVRLGEGRRVSALSGRDALSKLHRALEAERYGVQPAAHVPSSQVRSWLHAVIATLPPRQASGSAREGRRQDPSGQPAA